MSTIVTINGNALPSSSRADLNTNFSNLNTDKIETSYLDTDTTLAANSDTKIATQKAVKAYVDAGGNVNASETTKGIVEEATDAEVTAGTATGGTGAKLFITPAKLTTYLGSAYPIVRTYTSTSTYLGTSTSRFDITNPSGTTFRYTWDGTGTDPGITSSNPATNAGVNIQGQNFSAANNGSFVVTSSGTNYFEVTNASGVSENDKTLGTGFLGIGTKWTKPTGLKYVVIETVGGGGTGGGANAAGLNNTASGGGGGGGGYTRKTVAASTLASTEVATVGAATKLSSFGNYGISQPGTNGTDEGNGGGGGTAASGDINITGQGGGSGTAENGSSSGFLVGGTGGSSTLGGGGYGVYSNTGGNGAAGGSYGGGGSGAVSAYPNGSYTGGSGAQGIVIVTEHY